MNHILLLLLFFFASSAFGATQGERATLSWSAGLGVSVSNSVRDEKSRAWDIEQETPTSHGIWQFGYLNEGHKRGDKRDGIYALLKLPYELTPTTETFFSFGPYFTATTVTEQDGIHYRDAYCWSLLGFAGIRYKLTDRWDAQSRWGARPLCP